MSVPPIPALMALLLLIAFARTLGRRWPALGFSRGKMLLVYDFLCFGVAPAGKGALRQFMPIVIALFNLLNILKTFNPDLTALGLKLELGGLFVDRPLSAMNPPTFRCRPEILSFTYLMPRELIASSLAAFASVEGSSPCSSESFSATSSSPA